MPCGAARAQSKEDSPAKQETAPGLEAKVSATPEEDFDFGEDAQAQRDQSRLEQLVHMGPAALRDPFGPRPAQAPVLDLDELLLLTAQNPRKAKAQAQLDAMQAMLNMARFAWIPSIKLNAFLSPGANIACDDIMLATTQPGTPHRFQYCRARSDANLDLNRVGDYLRDIQNAGISLRLEGDLLIPISSMGKGLAIKDAAKAGVALAALNALRVAQDTSLQTKQAYLAVELAQNSMEIIQEAWSILKRHQQKLAANEDDDPEALPRVELAQIEVARRAQQLRRIEGSARAALWALAGESAPEYFAIRTKSLELWRLPQGLASREYYHRLAQSSRPEALMAKSQLRLRRAQEKLAKRQYLPDLGLIVGFRLGYANKADVPRERYYDNRANFSAIYAGLGLRWEFVPSLRIFGLHRARAQTREAYADRDSARRWVALEVDRAYDELRVALEEVELSEMAISRARRLIATQEAKASVGEADFEKLNRSLESWAKLEFERLSAISRHNAAVAKLSRAVGQPLRQATR